MKLPTAIAEYFAAANSDDADRVSASPTTLSSTMRTRHPWPERRACLGGGDASQVSVSCQGGEGQEEADWNIVIAHLSGDFPGSPIDVRYRFKLAGPSNVALEIG